VKKAIDNYAIGKQIEVTAWKGQSIPASFHRFFCPECMEAVALDTRGHFRHKNRTLQSLECEKRVDSPSRTTYERMGLPLYIKKETDIVFRLYMGFPAIPKKIIDEASNAKAVVSIRNNASSIQYYISQERFDSEHFTYIPMDFFPSGNGKYKIEYDNAPNRIRECWTENSDIWGTGQFYKITEEYARKIRPLGTIVTDKEYYYSGSVYCFQHYKNCIDVTKVGILQVGNQSQPVYSIKVRSQDINSSFFKIVSSMFMETFHLSLLIGDSELLPIWPPCIIDENYLLYPINTKRAIMLVDSPNSTPIVYRYQGSCYSEISVDKDTSLLDMPITEMEIPVSIDKAFNGNIQYIRKQALQQCEQDILISVVDENNNLISNTPMESIKSKVFEISCSCPCNVFLVKSDGTDLLYKLSDEKGVTIRNVKWNDSLIVISNAGRLLFSYTFEQKTDILSEDACFIDKIRKIKGAVVPIDQQIIALYRRTAGHKTIHKELTKFIRIGYIPLRVVTLLKEVFGGEK